MARLANFELVVESVEYPLGSRASIVVKRAILIVSSTIFGTVAAELTLGYNHGLPLITQYRRRCHGD